MTRDEILRLEPGPELDRLMAEEVMGWEEGEDFDCSKEGPLIYYPSRNRVLGRKWSPSTDIAAAWEVIRKMLDSGWGCEIYSPNNPYALENADKWFVVFAKSGPIVMQLNFSAKAPSAPLAICRAALLAVKEASDEQ
ncbi:MAG: hypothetical protein DRN81_04505 [Thermoproteota archaeon]|nr:MAG: hypothetical protein DRN81_04505 [Candidatus Korarchaeota archaeon]